MHTFTSLNWLASHPPEPEPETSHPVRLSEETGDSNINVAAFSSQISKRPSQRYWRSHNTRVCLCSSFDQSDGKENSSQLCYLILGAETAGAGSAELPRRGTRDSALAPAGSQGSFNLAAK